MAIINPPAWSIEKGEKNALNILLNAFRIAINGALSVFGMVDGFVDEFEDETGIDTAESIDESYNSGGDYYESGTLDYGSNVFAGGTASASTVSGSFAASKAFDGIKANGDGWRATTSNSGWLKYDLGSGNGVAINRYKLITANSGNTNVRPMTWTLEGSNDDSAWTTLDTVADGEIVDGVEKTFDFVNSTAYRYYRINITATEGGHEPMITELEGYAGAINDMTLISEPQTAEVEPKTARIVVFEEDVDAVTINTDLKAYVSRDDGTTWTQITLSDEGDYGSGARILTGQIGITAQPSGTDMRYKIETDNQKNLRIHGVALTWD